MKDWIANSVLLWLVVTGLQLVACAPAVPLDSPQHTQIMQDKKSKIALNELQNKEFTITLEQALEMALAHNLDARVSALEVLSTQNNLSLEQLTALPEYTLTGSYQGRSNPGGSSSRSLNTGRQSLEPSISTDRHRRTVDLDAKWNLIDLVLTAYRSETARDNIKTAQERHRKVVQNILLDVYSAYWRSLAHQNTSARAGTLIKHAEAKLKELEQMRQSDVLNIEETAELKSSLVQSIQDIQRTRAELEPAITELKSLLAIPLSTELILQEPDTSLVQKIPMLLHTDLNKLEDEALIKRPELREALINEYIVRRELRQEIASTFPGIEAFFGFNHDGNRFLTETQWQNFSLSVVQDIAKLFTLPARIRQARNNEELQKQRALALSAAIVTQVHLARHRLDLLNMQAALAQSSQQEAKRLRFSSQKKHQQGFSSGMQTLRAQLSEQSATLRASAAQAELQQAVASLMITLGRPVADLEKYEKGGVS